MVNGISCGYCLHGGSLGLSKWVKNGITRVTIWVIRVIDLITKSP